MRRIEGLAGAEQHARERIGEELAARPSRAVEDQDRVSDAARAVAPRLTQRAVVQPQLRKSLAALEAELARDEVAFHRLPWRGRRRRSGQDEASDQRRSHRAMLLPAENQAATRTERYSQDAAL